MHRIVRLTLPLLLAAACGPASQVTLSGEVEAAEIDVGVKIAGRIARILVREGDSVRKDQIMGYLESRELEARLQTVQAAYDDAQQQLELAKATFARIKALHDAAAVAKQVYDDARYKFEASKQRVEATAGQLAEVRVAYGEMIIKSPLDGEVVSVISRAGEIVSAGYPIITVLDLKDQWVVFNLREDLLKAVKKGDALHVGFTALGGKTVPCTVSYVAALGAFAKWKATGETGSFDLKTFELRARPVEPDERLRPGMTARVTLSR